MGHVAILTAYAAATGMVDLTYGDLNAGDLGYNTADTLRNIANAAADTVCTLYRNYPSGIIPSIGTSPPGQFTDGLLRNLCSPRGTLPPPASQPFTGGQCVALYNIVYKLGPPGSTPPNQTLTNCAGPVGGFEFRPAAAGGGLVDIYLKLGAAIPGASFSGSVLLGASFDNGAIAQILNVQKTDGTADTCGDPPITYPPTVAPVTNYNDNRTITIGGNTVNTPVTIIPTVFAPLTVFRPELNVKVGPVNVNFSLGGITFSPTFELNGTVNLPGTDPRTTPPPSTKPKDPANQPGCDLTEVLMLLEDVKKCACEEGTVKLVSYGPSEGREISLPAKTLAVAITTNAIGAGVNSQVGAGDSRDVLFIGWYAFGYGGDPGERIPISFASNNAIAPKNAQHFTYSMNKGSTASLTVYYLDQS
jgi:hypothetical protein